jgi:hypothetical protein
MHVEDTMVGDLLSKAAFEIILADVTSCRKGEDALTAAIQRASSACVELEKQSVGLEMSDVESTKLTSLMGRLKHKVQYLEAVQYLESFACA